MSGQPAKASGPSDQPTEARERLLSHFKDHDPSDHGKKWDELWVQGFLPWDKGFPNPALVDFLAERHDLVPPPRKGGLRKKALVPGCGKGYDVLLLAACGYDAWGLDFSQNALQAAKEIEGKVGEGEVYKVREGVDKGSVNWVAGDFFKDEFLNGVEGGKFDIIYDYTFLSALPPTLRPAWARRMKELLTPKGRLVCMEFPTYKPPSTGGPPWALPPKIYTAHLPRPGTELKYGEGGELLESELGPSDPEGLQQIAHFQPKRTHTIGYDADGKITDWIGVWAQPESK